MSRIGLCMTLALAAGCLGATQAHAQLSTSPGGTVSGNTVFSKTMSSTARDAQVHIDDSIIGSGVNGPATAQGGLFVDSEKSDWFRGTNAAVGEIDPLRITGRQGGAGSDMSGILVDVQNSTAGSGFLSATEMAANQVDPTTNKLVRGIDIQEATIYPNSNEGFVAISNIGVNNDAFLAIPNGATGFGGTWTNLFKGKNLAGDAFVIDGNGNIILAGYAAFKGTLAAGSTTIAALPTSCVAGQQLYETDGLKPGEASGSGSGVPLICTAPASGGTPAWVSTLASTSTTTSTSSGTGQTLIGPYTFTASDCGNTVIDQSNGAHNDTVPTGLPAWCHITVIQDRANASSGIGNITIVGATGETIKAANGATDVGDGAVMHIRTGASTTAFVSGG